MSSNNNIAKKPANKSAGNKKDQTSIKRDQRNLNLKLFSIGSIVLLIAIVLVVNIIFDSLIGDKLTFDFSSTGQNSITSVSEDYIKSLPSDTDIRIVGLFDEPTDLTGSPLEYMVPLLNDYQAKSGGRITVEYINPTTHPSIMQELDPNGLYDLKADIYAVEYNGKIKTIVPLDCFSYDETTYYQTGGLLPISNSVESKFTNAIMSLVNGYAGKVYFVTNLNESYGHLMLSQILEGIGYESEDLPAADSFAVPSDCSLLVISGINSDLSENMAQQIITYINQGGKVIVAIDFMYNYATDYTNLNAVLEVMNLKIDSNLVMEQDTSYLYNSSNPLESKVTIASDYTVYNPSVTYLRSSLNRSVTTAGNPASYITVAPVLQTSDKAGLTDISGQAPTIISGTTGQYNIGMHSEFSDAKGQEMYVFGTLNFTSDYYIGQYGTTDSNVVFIRNIISDMLDAGDTIIVDSKPIADYSLDEDKLSNDKSTLMRTVFMVVIPLAMVICGVIVYNKRKNL